MSRSRHRIERGDILALEVYAAERRQRRAENIVRKKNRRIPVGPDVTFYFENYDTMWMQVHEMLYTERGGEEQLADELEAYNPLIPGGRELVATMMIEIADEGRRRTVLARLGGIEDRVSITIGGETIRAVPEREVERTTEAGKTSAVHFLHFPFTTRQIERFRDSERPAALAVDHPEYGHAASIIGAARKELGGDFD